jgi:LuxR family transcriptional regulator, maltose regulon positive regulatory protein
MQDGLIATKFHSPLPVGRLTVRPRLDTRLDESLTAGCRVVLITAPAGYGKSTLASAWLRKLDIPFAWLSLDSSDNEPRQFLSYLVGALQKIDSSMGMSQANRIQTADTADREAVYADVMAHLVNEIEAFSSTFVLVLDDCHLLKNPTILQLLNFLIERQPAQMHIALLTREDLPLPVARLRVRRQMVEIRQADLQFTPEEVDDFLREGMGLTLSSREIAALEQRTEGWIAGLQLAALSMKYDPDPAGFIDSFTGSDRYILDYLLDEVFHHQSQEIQTFLLSTSVLDRFCAPLCDTVLEELLGQPVETPSLSQALLELVERSNLFLIPLDNHREWYRYHHLFADLLHHALHQAFPQKIPALHLRASQWLEANGFIQESVAHAFKAGNWQYSADLVERHAWNQITHSRVATASDWCNAFPEKVISRRPALCIFHAWALIIAFKRSDFPAANIRFEQAEAALAEIDPELEAALVPGSPPVRLHPWVKGQITLLRSFALMTAPRREANPQELIRLGQLAYEQIPVEDIPARSASQLDICYASQALCDAEDAEKKFEQVVAFALSGGNFFGALVAEYHRAHGMFTQGRLSDVIDFCQQKKRTYEGMFAHPLQDLPAIALLDQAMGCALLEQNELAEAERLLRSSLEVGQWMPREEVPGYLALARACIARGDLPGHMDALRRLEMRWPDISYCTQAMRIVASLKANPEDPNIQRSASAWASTHLPDIGPGIVVPGIGPAWNDEADYAVFTAWEQVMILLDQPAEALPVLQPLLKAAETHHLVHRTIDLCLLQAQALYQMQRLDGVYSILDRVLPLAEQHGYLRLVDQGPILIRILNDALQLSAYHDYICQLLQACPPGSARPAEAQQRSFISASLAVPASQASSDLPLPSPILFEPLSNREIEVLKWMAQGLSNPEIAERLYLSPNTMKTHTHNIYGKLDVHSRVQAVNRARELKLI